MTRAAGRPAVGDLDLRDWFEGHPDGEDAEAVTTAFARALAELAGRGGGRLCLPPGDWWVAEGVPAASSAVVVDTPGTTITGSGVLATRLRLVPDAACHVATVVAPGVTIERLSVFGNLSAQPEEVRARRRPPDRITHGITYRVAPAFGMVRQVLVEDVVGYGVSFRVVRSDQSVEHDPFRQVVLRDVVIRGCGDDAVDLKMRPTDIEHPADEPLGSEGPRAWIRNLSVRDHSRLWPNHYDQERGENGVDGRGQLHLQNIEVLGVRPDEPGHRGANGIQLRDETGGQGIAGISSAEHGHGGQWSTLDNYYVARRPGSPEGDPGGGVLVSGRLAEVTRVGNGLVVTWDDGQDRAFPVLGEGDSPGGLDPPVEVSVDPPSDGGDAELEDPR